MTIPAVTDRKKQEVLAVQYQPRAEVMTRVKVRLGSKQYLEPGQFVVCQLCTSNTGRALAEYLRRVGKIDPAVLPVVRDL